MNPKKWWSQAIVMVLVLVCSALPVAADSVQLANGDVLNGRVLSLDDKQLRLESDTLGQINIARGKIVAIMLGEQKKSTAVAMPKVGNTPADILKQLKTTGVNPKDIGDIQKMFPLLASPEASSYFNDTVKGLLGGSVSVGDIRKDAIRARDELKKATKGLGPDVEAGVAPYLMILEKFIGETQPTPTTKPQKTETKEKK